jgi:hypothetical protein
MTAVRLVLIAALVVSLCGIVQSAEDEYTVGELRPHCETLMGPQESPEDTVWAETCRRAVTDYLWDNNFLSAELMADPNAEVHLDEWWTKAECAYRIILDTKTPAAASLSEALADYADTCM